MEENHSMQVDNLQSKQEWIKPELQLLDLNQGTLGVNHHGPDTYASSC